MLINILSARLILRPLDTPFISPGKGSGKCPSMYKAIFSTKGSAKAGNVECIFFSWSAVRILHNSSWYLAISVLGVDQGQCCKLELEMVHFVGQHKPQRKRRHGTKIPPSSTMYVMRTSVRFESADFRFLKILVTVTQFPVLELTFETSSGGWVVQLAKDLKSLSFLLVPLWAC